MQDEEKKEIVVEGLDLKAAIADEKAYAAQQAAAKATDAVAKPAPDIESIRGKLAAGIPESELHPDERKVLQVYKQASRDRLSRTRPDKLTDAELEAALMVSKGARRDRIHAVASLRNITVMREVKAGITELIGLIRGYGAQFGHIRSDMRKLVKLAREQLLSTDWDEDIDKLLKSKFDEEE